MVKKYSDRIQFLNISSRAKENLYQFLLMQMKLYTIHKAYKPIDRTIRPITKRLQARQSKMYHTLASIWYKELKDEYLRSFGVLFKEIALHHKFVSRTSPIVDFQVKRFIDILFRIQKKSLKFSKSRTFRLLKYRKYSLRYCRLAKCVFFKNNNCIKLLSPSDNKDAKKLLNSTGYCHSYQTKYELKFRKIAFRIISSIKDKFSRKLQKEISRLSEIPLIDFNHNIAQSHFNSEALTILLSLEMNLEKTYDSTPNSPLEKAKEKLLDLSKSFYYIKEHLNNVINRGFGKRPYKKATKDFHNVFSEIFQEYVNFIKYLKKYRRKLQLKNFLLDNLFSGIKSNLEIDINNLTLNTYFYFRDFYNKERDYLVRNIGRIKGEKEWIDYNLSPSRNLYYEENSQDSYISQIFDDKIENMPIFRILRKRKLWIEIQNIYTLELVKILYSHSYRIYTIYFSEHINLDNPTNPSRIDYFLTPT